MLYGAQRPRIEASAPDALPHVIHWCGGSAGRGALTVLGGACVHNLRMDHDYLVGLRQHHPGWRLLRADSAPLVIAFLHRAFIAPNVRSLSEQALAAQLDDYLHHLRGDEADEAASGRRPIDYLRQWSDDQHGWLRRYYPADSDEAHYDLTPATEHAIHWLAGLGQQQFVGAESRLKLVFDLLRQIHEGAETDPERRIQELENRRAEIDAEIAEIRDGNMRFMDATQTRERFLQAADTARALLSDFRQVEENFRTLDRQVRERIATAEGSKAELLQTVFGERDAIAESDQGRSFHAFWDFLMSPARQEELTQLLEDVMALEPVAATAPDARLKRIHYDWLGAGEATQRTVAKLSAQLRRYLDEQAWLENRRVMDILRGIEQHALALRDDPPRESVMAIDEAAPGIELPMERPLFSPPIKPRIAEQVLAEGDAELSTEALFAQHHVDRQRLRSRLNRALQGRNQVRLDQLLADSPLEQGLAELVAWMRLAAEEGCAVVDEQAQHRVQWQDSEGVTRRATLPAVIFVAVPPA